MEAELNASGWLDTLHRLTVEAIKTGVESFVNNSQRVRDSKYRRQYVGESQN